jgi:hypothetical protein
VLHENGVISMLELFIGTSPLSPYWSFPMLTRGGIGTQIYQRQKNYRYLSLKSNIEIY